MVKRLPTMWETQVQSLGREDLLEKEMATHSSILAWKKIPWMEEPGRLQSMGSQRVRHNWATSLSFFLSFFTLPSEIPKLPKDLERVSWCLETSLLQLPPQDSSPSLTPLSLFLSFIFCPTSFWRKWAAFLGAWCPLLVFGSCFVELAQRSNDLWWICGGESGLPILFLCRLKTTFPKLSHKILQKSPKQLSGQTQYLYTMLYKCLNVLE